MPENFLFTSERLGFRNWQSADFSKMAAISANPIVMEHFPATATTEQTEVFLKKMQLLFAKKGYCYFATVELKSKTLIGFIGLAEKDFEAPFTPCIDIGWRLHPSFWNLGYATEGALACLKFGFENLQLSNIKATAPLCNVNSIKVMQKIGMKHQLDFEHPLLTDFPRLLHCTCYQISNEDYK